VLYRLSYTHHDVHKHAALARPEQCTGSSRGLCYPFGSSVPYRLAISLDVTLSGPGAATNSASR
jgi:hypothetical protein